MLQNPLSCLDKVPQFKSPLAYYFETLLVGGGL